MNESDEELLRWKADALQLLAGWDAVFEMVPKRDSDLGRSKHDVVADEVVRLRDEIVRLRAEVERLMDDMAKGAPKKWVVSYTPAQQAVIQRLAAEALSQEARREQ